LETVEFAVRLARVVARSTGKPTYVGNSASFASAGRGGDVEEEMRGFRKIVDVISELLQTNDGAKDRM